MKYNNECNAIDLCIRKRKNLDDFINEKITTLFLNKITEVIDGSLTKNNQLLHQINNLDITDHINLNNKCSSTITVKSEVVIYIKKNTRKISDNESSKTTR